MSKNTIQNITTQTTLHLIFSLLFTILFFLPDLLFKLMHSEYFIFNLKVYKEFIGLFVLNMILLSIGSFKLRYLLYTLFYTFSFTELLHYSFFHSLIMPYEVPMLFDQSEEILDSLGGVWLKIKSPIPITE